jgi:hypothetical protein
MSLIAETRVSLKKFLSLSEKYDHYDRYIRLYSFNDVDGVRRLLVLTHQEIAAKNPADKNNDLKTTVSFFCEVPISHLSVHLHSPDSSDYSKRPLKVFHLHYHDSWNFLSCLKLFDVTKADKMQIEYYPDNNSTNNERKGLFQETITFILLKATKRGNRETYKVSVDNQFVEDTTRLIDRGDSQSFQIQDAIELLNMSVVED